MTTLATQQIKGNKRRRWKLSDRPSDPDEENSAKRELHQILNAFQHSADWGIYVCESFKDPRRHYLDDYWGEVQEEAHGIHDMRTKLGKFSEPLDTNAVATFNHFARSLERLAKRIDRVLCVEDDVQIIGVEEYPPVEAVIDLD
jgi:hypothetical protein